MREKILSFNSNKRKDELSHWCWFCKSQQMSPSSTELGECATFNRRTTFSEHDFPLCGIDETPPLDDPPVGSQLLLIHSGCCYKGCKKFACVDGLLIRSDRGTWYGWLGHAADDGYMDGYYAAVGLAVCPARRISDWVKYIQRNDVMCGLIGCRITVSVSIITWSMFNDRHP
jgi:hypothetical protein